MESSVAPLRSPPRKRLVYLVVLAAGVALALFFAKLAPHEQHLRFVLGDAAGDVTDLDVEYESDEGEVLRSAAMHFTEGEAPRIVTHEPSIKNGTYRVHVEVHSRQGVRTYDRRVELEGGTTSIDLADRSNAKEMRR